MNDETIHRNGTRRGRAGAAVLGATAVAAITAVSAPAQAQELGEPARIQDNVGPGASVRPGVYFPSSGNTGVSLDANATLGIAEDPVVIAPGGRFAAYVGDQGAISGMPIVEVMLPVAGTIVPYGKAGVGIGHTNGPGQTGLALMAGAGVDLHVSRDVLVGVDATWETISGTGFDTVAIGPRASLRY